MQQKGRETSTETVDVETIYVTVRVSSGLYDCNHNCLTGVIKRTEPTFQTAMQQGDLIALKEEIQYAYGRIEPKGESGIFVSQVDYSCDGVLAMLVVISYNGEVLARRMCKDIEASFGPSSFDEDALRLQAVDELVSTVERLVENANHAYKKATGRDTNRC